MGIACFTLRIFRIYMSLLIVRFEIFKTRVYMNMEIEYGYNNL